MSAINSVSGATLTAFYDRYQDAEEARTRLVSAGIPASDIRLTPEQSTTSSAAPTQERHKGFFESLADMFMPDEDRYSYAEGLNRGGTMLTVNNVPNSLYDTTLDILDDEGAVDFDQREQSWKSEGWSGYQGSSLGGASSGSGASSGLGAGLTGAAGGLGGAVGLGDTTRSSSSYGNAGLGTGSSTGYGAGTTSGLGNEEVIPVVEEQLQIGKRDVSHGRVRVRSYVREVPVNEAVNLREEHVTLERRPVNRTLTGTEATFQDRVIEAEERGEEAVVAKQARVVEEIAVHKDVTNREQVISDTVRHTEVEVEDDRTITDRTGTLGTNKDRF